MHIFSIHPPHRILNALITTSFTLALITACNSGSRLLHIARMLRNTGITACACTRPRACTKRLHTVGDRIRFDNLLITACTNFRFSIHPPHRVLNALITASFTPALITACNSDSRLLHIARMLRNTRITNAHALDREHAPSAYIPLGTAFASTSCLSPLATFSAQPRHLLSSGES